MDEYIQLLAIEKGDNSSFNYLAQMPAFVPIDIGDLVVLTGGSDLYTVIAQVDINRQYYADTVNLIAKAASYDDIDSVPRVQTVYHAENVEYPAEGEANDAKA